MGSPPCRVAPDREGRFSTELFERYQRSERALVAALAEMYVQGVSTRKVKAITEELCGHSFSASSISAINKRLDASLAEFAGRRLEEPYPYLILDARYERVREAGVIRSQAVLLAVAVGWVTGPATTAGRWSRGSASLSCGCRKTVRVGSRPSCSSAISARSGHSWRRERRRQGLVY